MVWEVVEAPLWGCHFSLTCSVGKENPCELVPVRVCGCVRTALPH